MSKARNLNRLAYFAAVADTGSFTRAAERLGITKAVVSQQVAQLEQEIGTTLLVRTTRHVSPTAAGRLFHERCTLILREAEDAYGELAQAANEPTGVLRITAPNDYGTSIVTPVVAAFAKRYSDCRVDLQLNDTTADLSTGEIDLAIRVGWLADSSLQARRIGSFQQILIDSPTRAASLPPIRHPEEIAAHPFVANGALREPLVWQFSHETLDPCRVRMQQEITIDATRAVLAAVQADAGLSIVPDFLVEDLLASGKLVQILPDWQLPSGGVHTVYPAARFRPAKVTAFVSMLADTEKRRRLATP